MIAWSGLGREHPSPPPVPGGGSLHRFPPPKSYKPPRTTHVDAGMTEPKQQGFKTLLQEERERHSKPKSVSNVHKSWWKREAKYWNSCPYVEDFICGPSKKYRALGEFVCSGSWHQTCGIFLRVKKAGDDPAVLALEG